MSLIELPIFFSHYFNFIHFVLAMSKPVCIFHHYQCASNLQQILNLLRKHVIKVKCDLNAIGRKFLCVCKLSGYLLLIADEVYYKKRADFEKLKDHPWFREINRLIELKIMTICQDKISLFKLWNLICDISNEKSLLHILNFIPTKKRNIKKTTHPIYSIRQQIELSLTVDQIGPLLGRNGRLHKNIMEKTETQIHFENLPYSTHSRNKHDSDFDLDSFQSLSPIQVTISGRTLEAIDDAIQALEDRAKIVQAQKQSFFSK